MRVALSWCSSALLALSCSGFASGFTLPSARAPVVVPAASPRMMFGGGDKEGGGFMDKLKQAQQMFNPEMMKKYAEVGEKVQELQQELSATEIECATKDGGVVVKVTGTQVPLSVTVSDSLVTQGADKVSAELSAALKQAHAKSGTYSQQKMAKMYEDLGLGAPPPQ